MAMKKPTEYLKGFESKKNPDDLIEKLLEDPSIRRFVLDNDLKHETLAMNVNLFLTYQESKAICQKCSGIFECKLESLGMTPSLRYYEGDVILEYRKCRYNTSDEAKRNIETYYIPRKVFEADLSDFDLLGDERKAIHNRIIQFLKEYDKEHPSKGMYLSGLPQTGKTYVLATIANELARKGYNIIFAYYPDLVRDLKSSISGGDLEDRIEELKTVDILMLDDLGGEAPSAFVRDEILGPILQHRIMDTLPTFFSSNLDMKFLLNHFALDNSQYEKTKALRIYERVRELSDEFRISEKPRHRT